MADLKPFGESSKVRVWRCPICAPDGQATGCYVQPLRIAAPPPHGCAACGFDLSGVTPVIEDHLMFVRQLMRECGATNAEEPTDA